MQTTLKARLDLKGLSLLAAMLIVHLPGDAAAFDYFWVGGAGSWTDSGNWDTGLVPEAQFQELGIINNGGVATLSTAAADSAGLVLGQAAGESGSLIVQSGGSISLVETAGAAADVPPVGTLNIGLDGTGVVEVQGGGALSTTLVDMNNGSVLEIGGGAGAASVTSTDGMWLAGRTITHGAGHTFTAATFVTFEAGSEYVVNLSSGAHTKLTAGGTINNVQGSLVVQLSGGLSPTLGQSWDILDGAGITGDFVVDSSAVGALSPGTAYTTRQVSGGNGEIMQLVYKAVPTMKVNTDTGVVTITSESGNAVNLIGYSVVSDAGSLTPGAWNSLADQGQGDWEEAGLPSANAVNELIGQGSFALTGATYNLGAIYSPPTEFGVGPSIEFEYAEEGDEASSLGLVEITGAYAVNNLVLTVDPTTGEGQLRNDSPFDIELQGYSVLSGSGALDDANWTSLESGSEPGWDDAASDEFSLNELVPEGDAMIAAGQAYSLGDMFLVGGDQDLSLEFVLSVEGVGEMRQGIVEYGAIPAGVPGDYNSNGVVDAADYTVWRDNLGAGGLDNEGDGVSPGTVDAADYAFWVSRYGAASSVEAGAGAASAPVPEPSALLAGLWGLLAACGLVARRRPACCRVAAA